MPDDEVRVTRQRQYEQEFILFFKNCVDTCTRDGDKISSLMMFTLLEAIRQRMAVKDCSFQDIITAVHNARPSPRADHLPIEDIPTPNFRRPK